MIVHDKIDRGLRLGKEHTQQNQSTRMNQEPQHTRTSINNRERRVVQVTICFRFMQMVVLCRKIKR